MAVHIAASGYLGLMVIVLIAMASTGRARAQAGPSATPMSGVIDVAPGFLPDPVQISVVSGGGVNAQTMGAHCRGFVSAQPDVALDVEATIAWARVYVASTADTTLVVRRPDGTLWCADDTYGMHPSLEGTLSTGRYLIWVGAYRADSNARATLSVTQNRTLHP